jgi:hypothetical protein
MQFNPALAAAYSAAMASLNDTQPSGSGGGGGGGGGGRGGETPPPPPPPPPAALPRSRRPHRHAARHAAACGLPHRGACPCRHGELIVPTCTAVFCCMTCVSLILGLALTLAALCW